MLLKRGKLVLLHTMLEFSSNDRVLALRALAAM